MKSKLETKWLQLKKRMGWMTDHEFLDAINTKRRKILDKLPVRARQEVESIENLSNRLLSTEAMTDWNAYFRMGSELSERLQSFCSQYSSDLNKDTIERLGFISGLDELGYRPAGAHVHGFMMSPFAPFTFFYENHWAVKATVDCVITEVTHDGFSMVYGRGVKADRLKQVKEMIDRLDIWQLRLDLLRDYLVYGNSLVLPHFNGLGELLSLEKLVMDKVTPIWSRLSDELIGWDYWVGHHMIPYLRDRVAHLKDKSLRNPWIGLPGLQCMLTDLESDLGASSLNNTAMWKAGMVGILISLADNDSGSQNISGTPFSRRLKDEIMASFSGVKAGNSILVSNYVKNVFKLNNLSEFDAAFLKFREKVAIMVATVLKVPPEQINLNRSSSLQYAAARLEDTVNAGFDRAIASYMTKIDKFINDEILKKLCGIYDVEIQANGRYGSMTLNSARAGLIASQTGAIFDINEYRTIFYGAAPLPFDDPRGREILDNSKGPGEEAKRGKTRFSKESLSAQAGTTSMASKYVQNRDYSRAA